MNIESRYNNLTKIGEGGMAVVYRAHDTKLGRDVAIKVIAPQFASDAKFRARFMREVQLLAKLQHPNIVPVYDYDVSDTGAYYVMALIEGVNLRKRIADDSIDQESFALIAEGLLSGLGYAHRMRIVHRDIKPENILVDAEGNPFLTDFGIARLIDSDATKMTRTGTFLGTAIYAAPEQFEEKAVGPAADIYSLGIIFYEMFTGNPPFTGTLSRIMKGHLLEPAAPFDPRILVLQKHPEVGDTIQAMLQKEPEKRPQSCEEVYSMMDRQAGSMSLVNRQNGETASHADAPERRSPVEHVANPEKRDKKELNRIISLGIWQIILGLTVMIIPLFVYSSGGYGRNGLVLPLAFMFGIAIALASVFFFFRIKPGLKMSLFVTSIMFILILYKLDKAFQNSDKPVIFMALFLLITALLIVQSAGIAAWNASDKNSTNPKKQIPSFAVFVAVISFVALIVFLVLLVVALQNGIYKY